ncbi:hypothetical protein GCM10022255_000900 [Dactylosporangium darangshiense]|uniref:Uncharacterized protein n=1 Tax=Dactylosporangium darangshiense TaxID=579108 RepID=A0ABP8CTA1_9ACTN
MSKIVGESLVGLSGSAAGAAKTDDDSLFETFVAAPTTGRLAGKSRLPAVQPEHARAAAPATGMWPLRKRLDVAGLLGVGNEVQHRAGSTYVVRLAISAPAMRNAPTP